MRMIRPEVAIIVLVFALADIGVFVLGQMSSQLLIPTAGRIAHISPAYTIWTDGVFTYAVDASGSQPSWGASTDAVTVINQAIKSTNMGAILLNSGTYIIRSTILSSGKSNIELYGEGEGQTVIQLAAGQPYPGDMLNILGSSTSSLTDWYVHDLTFDGNSQNQGSAGHLQLYHNLATRYDGLVWQK
jgi:hypothetical protein